MLTHSNNFSTLSVYIQILLSVIFLNDERNSYRDNA